MRPKEFQEAMTKAKLMARLEPERQDHWRGYVQGLRRGYYGEKFGTEEEHQKWWAAADEKNASRQELGQGYRAGFRCATLGRRSG